MEKQKKIILSKQIDHSLIISKKTRNHKEHQTIMKPIRPLNHIRLYYQLINRTSYMNDTKQDLKD